MLLWEHVGVVSSKPPPQKKGAEVAHICEYVRDFFILFSLAEAKKSAGFVKYLSGKVPPETPNMNIYHLITFIASRYARYCICNVYNDL